MSTIKVCVICGRKYSRMPGKSDKVWSNQKACGRDCSAILRRKPDAEVGKTAIKRRKQLKPGSRSHSWLKVG